jgi:succinate dehydrogenase/fumarate reductase cytochrome b subunit
MTDLEAIEILQERARKYARVFHVCAGVATLAVGAALWGLLLALQFAFLPMAEAKITALIAFSIAAAVMPRVFNGALKLRLAAKRQGWIDELVKHEGAKRDVLESSFTLDSW